MPEEKWTSIMTDAGEVRYRGLEWDDDEDCSKFRIAYGDQTWEGIFTEDDTGSTYEVAGIFASEVSYIDLIGQEHASDLRSFVLFAAPHLIRGTRPSEDIGKPSDD